MIDAKGAIVALLVLGLVACSRPDTSHTVIPSSSPGVAKLQSTAPLSDDGQWLMQSKDYANTRFSGLDQINSENAGGLRLEWTFSTGVTQGHEAGPLVVGDTMYYVGPFPNVLYALNVADGTLKWAYHPNPEPSAKGVACCDHVNRGAVFANGRVFFNTLDNNTIAVDAATGKEVWRTKLGEITRGETITMSPLVVKGKVLVGNSGGEFGVRGWMTALDANTGQIVWRAYHTGPDKDVLIGPSFKPFYPDHKGKDLGVVSWPPDKWRIGGATAWGWIQYDPELDLIYYGTGNPGPWNPDMRHGDNKWSATIFARKPDTGEAVWAYQFSPHSIFDYDAVNESILTDLPVNGVTRKVLMRAERNGFFYVFDRTTGEVLSAKPYVISTSTRGVDLKTGRPYEDWQRAGGMGKTGRGICPAVPGGKDWEPMAYSPRTGLVYIPALNLCMDMTGVETNYIAGTPYVGTNTRMYAGPGGNRGEFIGWDPVAGTKKWQIKEPLPVYAGAVATAGDVVFYGTMDRWFKAIDARSGKELWKFRTGSGIISCPMTYKAPNGKQYVAVADGVGGWPGGVVVSGQDPRDQYAGDGFANAMSDLPRYTGKGGTIYVFALP